MAEKRLAGKYEAGERKEGNGVAVQEFIDKTAEDRRKYDIYADIPVAERMQDERKWRLDDETGREVLEYNPSSHRGPSETTYTLRGVGIELRRKDDEHTIHIDPSLRADLEVEKSRPTGSDIGPERLAFGYEVTEKGFAPATPITPCKDN